MKCADIHTLPLPLPTLTGAQQTAIEHALVLLVIKCEGEIRDLIAAGDGAPLMRVYWHQTREAAQQALAVFWPKVYVG